MVSNNKMVARKVIENTKTNMEQIGRSSVTLSISSDVLGFLKWDHDERSAYVSSGITNTPLTHRSVLYLAASSFDPIRTLAPFIVKTPLLLEKI